MLTGVTGWALSAGIYPLMAGSVAIWGLGFASTNSMQQVRLVGAAPALASASVSLNTSVLYVGQAVGSAIGGVLYARDLLYARGYVAMAFVALALMTVITSAVSGKRRSDCHASDAVRAPYLPARRQRCPRRPVSAPASMPS